MTLTPDTVIHTPDLIRGGRNPWTGTIGEYVYTVCNCLEAHLRIFKWLHGHKINVGPEEDLILEKELARVPEGLELDFLRSLTDDPNVRIVENTTD